MCKKIFFGIIIIFGTIIIFETILTGCKMIHDDCDTCTQFDGKITVTVEGNEKLLENIAKVYAICRVNKLEEVISNADFGNKGFTMQLPATPSEKYLEKPNVSKVSDNNAQIVRIVKHFKAYDADGEHIGNIVFNEELWYADRIVRLSLNGQCFYSLKKGWNNVAGYGTGTVDNIKGNFNSL